MENFGGGRHHPASPSCSKYSPVFRVLSHGPHLQRHKYLTCTSRPADRRPAPMPYPHLSRNTPSPHQRDPSGPGRRARGPIGGAEPRSQNGMRIAPSDASSAPCLSTDDRRTPRDGRRPRRGSEGELRASAVLASSEGSLNAVKAAAAGAECPPAWAAARARPLSLAAACRPITTPKLMCSPRGNQSMVWPVSHRPAINRALSQCKATVRRS